MSARIKVSSEVARLRKVIVHYPGPELLAVTPSTRQEYLYDDIIDASGARLEHAQFVGLLKQFAEVLDVRTLLQETLQSEDARNFLIQRSQEITADKTIGLALQGISIEQLVNRYIEGWHQEAGPFSKCLETSSYILPPLPNLFFSRDAAMVIGEGVVIGAMRFSSRWPEEALMRTIFEYHPSFQGTPVYYDGSDERRHGYSIEGGDVHPLRADTVMVGLSERTSVASLDVLSEILFKQSGIEHVIAVLLPEHSTAIHLDMVLTQVSQHQFAAYAPLFRGLYKAPILYRSKKNAHVEQVEDLFKLLSRLGMQAEPIFVGGHDFGQQQREQWASSCNFFAVAPGQVLAYDRNEKTLKDMEHAGFRIIEGKKILLGEESVKPNEACVMTFHGSELVRGGGGPRCMTCPILRDDCVS